MHKIVDETLLTKFALRLGDSALIAITSSIYSSTFFKFIMLSFFTFSIISFGWGIHRKEISKRSIYAAIAFFLSYPSQGKPIAFRLVNGLSSSAAFVFQKGVLKFTANSDDPQMRDNLPSGLAMELIVASASSKLKSEETRSLFQGFVLNCLPNALTKNGEPAKFDDLFNFKTIHTKDSSGKTIISYSEKVLDETALRNDTSYENFKDGKNCYQGLEDMRLSMAKDISDKPDYLTNRIIEGSEQDPKTLEAWITNWKNTAPKLSDLATNLSMAHAAEYEKSNLISQKKWDYNSWWSGTATDKSLRELIIAMDGTTELGYKVSDIKNIFSNSFENRWAFSLGASIKDLKERIELVPYQLSAIKILLKILCPLMILTLFFGTFKFFFTWAGAWSVAALTPAIINASRSINNSILLSKLGIQDLTQSDAEGVKALAYGVDLSAAKQLLTDFTPLAYAMIEQEMAIIRYLAGAMLVGSWLAGGGANGFVSWMSNSVQGFLTSSVLGGGVNLTSQAIDKSIKTAKSYANPASYAMGQRTRSLIDGVNGQMPKISYSKAFKRKN